MNISRSALLPYSAQQMYNIVNDIRAYPQFLKWCKESQIISETSNDVVAKLLIKYSKLNFEFTTKNTNTQNQSIKLSLVDGPFNELHGEWRFDALNENACKVSLELQFDFKQKITKHIMAKVFSNLVSTQIEAFKDRANDLYGTNQCIK